MKGENNMQSMEMSDNTKLEVAIEILSAKIAKISKEGYSANDENMKKLLQEREKMYAGDMQVIEKIIKEYGPEIKNDYEGV